MGLGRRSREWSFVLVKILLRQIEDLTKDFNLKYKPSAFAYLLVSKEDIVLRNFLGGCPEPDYIAYGGRNEKRRMKNVVCFVNSTAFQIHKRKPQGCVINRKEAKRELSLAKNLNNHILRNKYGKLYSLILQSMIGNELILVSKPENKTEKLFVGEILSHEIVHQVLGSNNIVFSNITESLWKWDEGLCVYMDHFITNKHKKFAKKQKNTGKLSDVYAEYAHKWYVILEKAKTPQKRKQLILRKYKQLSNK